MQFILFVGECIAQQVLPEPQIIVRMKVAVCGIKDADTVRVSKVEQGDRIRLGDVGRARESQQT